MWIVCKYLQVAQDYCHQTDKSQSNLSRGQVDLIDLIDMNLAENMSPDHVTPFKYLLVYINHFTKKLSLNPLMRKSATQV